jgi:hypothetical protein
MPIQTKPPARKWRDVLPIHPAAELFPHMSPDELRELGEDIKNNGQHVPITVWKEQKHFPPQLLDGRSRLDALEAVGFAIEVENVGTDADPAIRLWEQRSPKHMRTPIEIVEVRGDRPGGDPYAYVISANIRRRHLSIDDKDRLIVQLLKADPTKSNRQVAKLTDTSHPHVAKVREQAQKTGDVETVTTSIDSKGRKQPAGKPPKAKRAKVADPPPQPSNEVLQQRAAAAERIRALMGRPEPPPRDDIGADSRAEAERLRVRVEELQAEKRRLEIKITRLESEIEELRAARDKRIEELIVERRKWANAPLPPLNLARLPLGDQLIILIGLLESGLAPIRNLVAALELPANASVKRRAQLDGIDGMVGAVFNWMSTTREYVAEIKQALDDYASATASTIPSTPAPADDGLDIPACLRREPAP